ncbi:MAG: ABC transporter ATP-binding protein [Firmicutes bacterium]|nr:ABC transporter ATP-binding protein [Bacillota bacterium]
MLLEVSDLAVFYGAIQALHGVSFRVDDREIVTLIGANGAGKSTTLRTVSGLIRPRGGRIVYQGCDLAKVPPHEIVRLGVSQCPEGRRVFTNLTVLENLEMGAYTRRDRREIAESLERVFRHFPRLKERVRQPAGTLSGGEQQMLAMGRALMARPRLLLLDEPSMGLSPILVEEIFAIIRDINAAGTTVLLVEQNAAMALSIADRAYVLETGRILFQGTAEEVKADPRVRAAYLGDVA